MSPRIVEILYQMIAFLFAISVHESAHAWTASRCGDPTARMLGRVSLNPIRHIDPIGTIVLPLVAAISHIPLLGWAKPTPVITRNFRKIVRDDNLTTLAGPVSNLLIVVVAFTILAIVALVIPDGHKVVIISFLSVLRPGEGIIPHPLLLVCSVAILVNLCLFFFNLLPIPPLDGSRILRNLLPYNAVQVYDRIPIWVSYLFMIFVGGFVMSLLLSPSIALVCYGLARL